MILNKLFPYTFSIKKNILEFKMYNNALLQINNKFHLEWKLSLKQFNDKLAFLRSKIKKKYWKILKNQEDRKQFEKDLNEKIKQLTSKLTLFNNKL